MQSQIVPFASIKKLVSGVNKFSLFWTDDASLLIQCKFPLFLFFHALRSCKVKKVIFSLQIIKHFSTEKIALEITDKYGSRSLSSLLSNQMNSTNEEIIQVLQKLLRYISTRRISEKAVLEQISSWIESCIGIDAVFKIMRTFKIEKCIQIMKLPIIISILSQEHYDRLVVNCLGGEGFLERAIDSRNRDTVRDFIEMLKEINVGILDWELNQLLQHAFTLDDNFYACRFTLPCFPDPIDCAPGREFNIITFKCSLRFFTSVPLNVNNKNDYLSFLKRQNWQEGLLYSACKTGKHKNIDWILIFLKNLISPSLIWQIEPLGYGENTVVTVLMSSGCSDQEICAGLKSLIAAGLPFHYLWDHFSSENCPISWIANCDITETEKGMFNDKLLESYSLIDVFNEIFVRYDKSDAIRITNCFKSDTMLEEVLSSNKALLFTLYESRFRRFLDFFIRYLLIKSQETPAEEINKNEIPVNVVFDLLTRLGTNPARMSCCEETIQMTTVNIKTILAEFDQRKDFETLESSQMLSTGSITSDLQQKYTVLLTENGIENGVLNAVLAIGNLDLVFACIRKLLKFPKILSTELTLFNNCDIDVHSSLQTQSKDKKLGDLFEIMFDSKEELLPLNFAFDAPGFENCMDLVFKWHSFDFLFLILYPSSSEHSFQVYINYDRLRPDIEKMNTHERVLRSKFSEEGLLYRACDTLQPENIQWASDFLKSIDECLLEVEMSTIYANGNTLVTFILSSFLRLRAECADDLTENDAGIGIQIVHNIIE